MFLGSCVLALREPGSVMAWACLIIFGAASAVDIWMRLTRRNRRLEIARGGFRLFAHGRPQSYRWDMIARFRTVSDTPSPQVGWDWSEIGMRELGIAPEDDDSAQDDVAHEILPSTYRLTPEALLELLEAHRRSGNQQTD